MERIEDFLGFHDERRCNEDSAYSLNSSLVEYFDHKRDESNSCGERRYSASTLAGWLSMFVAFWKHTGRGALKLLVPIIETKIKKWKKTEGVVQAQVFSKDDLGKYPLLLVW